MNGLEVYTAASAVRLAVTDRITRLLYTRALPASESSSVTLAEFDAATCVAFAVPRMPSGLGYLDIRFGHSLTITGTTIAWAPSIGVPAGRVASDLFVFAFG